MVGVAGANFAELAAAIVGAGCGVHPVVAGGVGLSGLVNNPVTVVVPFFQQRGGPMNETPLEPGEANGDLGRVDNHAGDRGVEHLCPGPGVA